MIEKPEASKSLDLSTRVRFGDTIILPAFVGAIATEEAKGSRTPITEPSALPPYLKKRYESLAADFQTMVLYEDDDAVAINKPHGMSVHEGTGTKGKVTVDEYLTAVSTLSLAEVQQNQSGPSEPGGSMDGEDVGELHTAPGSNDDIKSDMTRTVGTSTVPRLSLVHRLDRDCSGVLLIGKNRLAAAMLGEQFKLSTARVADNDHETKGGRETNEEEGKERLGDEMEGEIRDGTEIDPASKMADEGKAVKKVYWAITWGGPSGSLNLEELTSIDNEENHVRNGRGEEDESAVEGSIMTVKKVLTRSYEWLLDSIHKALQRKANDVTEQVAEDTVSVPASSVSSPLMTISLPLLELPNNSILNDKFGSYSIVDPRYLCGYRIGEGESRFNDDDDDDHRKLRNRKDVKVEGNASNWMDSTNDDIPLKSASNIKKKQNTRNSYGDVNDDYNPVNHTRRLLSLAEREKINLPAVRMSMSLASLVDQVWGKKKDKSTQGNKKNGGGGNESGPALLSSWLLSPLTGRKHQLRVHAASRFGLGCGIVGDPLYTVIEGDEDDIDGNKAAPSSERRGGRGGVIVNERGHGKGSHSDRERDRLGRVKGMGSGSKMVVSKAMYNEALRRVTRHCMNKYKLDEDQAHEMAEDALSKLHLHCRSMTFKSPQVNQYVDEGTSHQQITHSDHLGDSVSPTRQSGSGEEEWITITAPLPKHMVILAEAFGLETFKEAARIDTIEQNQTGNGQAWVSREPKKGNDIDSNG